MKQEETLLNNYVDLFAFICSKKEIEEDKLKLLEIKAKCLYVKTNKEEALNLQMEIQASRAFLQRVEEFILDVGDKYKKLALSFNNSDCMLFSCIFLEGKTPKQVSLELGVSQDYVYKKKVEFSKMVAEKLKDYDFKKLDIQKSTENKNV